jgi:ferredoxin-NADP reductase/predicted pyridoxine 5'-phosphate oxidase superfamily flavin-nucleotide-binding protein
MAHQFAKIAFTPAVRAIQSEMGSRDGYSAMDVGENYNYLLSEHEAAFIGARDSFYMASVSETGWPYVQHRGGPVGFMKVLDERTLGFADYSGNRQYVSTGNFEHNKRVSLFFMDYPNQRRLKMLGRVRVVGLEDADLLARLEDDHYRARVERGFVIEIEGFDWNCPQHITPRYSEAEVQAQLAPLQEELQALRSAGSAEASNTVPEHEPADSTAPGEVLGNGPVEVVISGIRQLTPDVRAYELRAPDGAQLPPVPAGAHLQIPVRLASGELVENHYSVASNPARRDIYEIAVLKEEEGRGGSVAIHHSFNLGQVLRIAPPISFFDLQADDRPAVLIAGGIGITPIKAMAQVLEARGTPFHLHYAGRSRKDMAYRQRLQLQLGKRLSVWAGDEGQRMDLHQILAAADEHARIYVCGPARLLDAVQQTASKLGLARDSVQFESFS